MEGEASTCAVDVGGRPVDCSLREGGAEGKVSWKSSPGGELENVRETGLFRGRDDLSGALGSQLPHLFLLHR